MRKLVLLLFAFAAIGINVQGQNAADTVKKESGIKKGCFKVSSTSIITGSNRYRTLDDNEHNGNDGSGYNHSHNGNMGYMYYGYNEDGIRRGYLKFELGLNPWSNKMGKYNKQQELNIGLFYSGANLEDHYSTDYVSTPGDTFSYNGVSYQTDTVARYDHTYINEANVLGVGAEYIFKTNPEKIVSLFTGVGINASFTLTSRIYENFYKDSAVMITMSGNEVDYYDFDNGYFLGEEFRESNVKADATVFTSVYIPFGINFRLAKKKEIWNQMNIFIKGNFGLETEFALNDKTSFNPFMGFGMGFKFNFK